MMEPISKNRSLRRPIQPHDKPKEPTPDQFERDYPHGDYYLDQQTTRVVNQTERTIPGQLLKVIVTIARQIHQELGGNTGLPPSVFTKARCKFATEEFKERFARERNRFPDLDITRILMGWHCGSKHSGHSPKFNNFI